MCIIRRPPFAPPWKSPPARARCALAHASTCMLAWPARFASCLHALAHLMPCMAACPAQLPPRSTPLSRPAVGAREGIGAVPHRSLSHHVFLRCVGPRCRLPRRHAGAAGASLCLKCALVQLICMDHVDVWIRGVGCPVTLVLQVRVSEAAVCLGQRFDPQMRGVAQQSLTMTFLPCKADRRALVPRAVHPPPGPYRPRWAHRPWRAAADARGAGGWLGGGLSFDLKGWLSVGWCWEGPAPAHARGAGG